MHHNRLFALATFLSIFVSACFPAYADTQQSSQSLDNKCTRIFPAIANPNYALAKIEFGIFALPEGGIVRFLVTDSSKSRASAAELLASLSKDKAEKQHLWWTTKPMGTAPLFDGQPMGAFIPIDSASFGESQTIGIVPALFIGNKAYCLVNQMNYSWSGSSDDKKTTYQINEEWYGTTAQSPIYAAVRIFWSPKPAH